MPWQILPGLDLEAASVSFDLPARTRFQSGGPAGIASLITSTERSTTLRLTLSQALFRVTFDPNLVINLPPPLGDMGLHSIERDLRTGDITPQAWYLAGLAVRVGLGDAIEQARAWMRSLISSTSLAIAPYDPSADPDLVLSLKQILANLQGGDGAGGARDIGITAKLVVRDELSADVGGGGFRIPAGATIALEASLPGTTAEIQASPKLARLVVDCSSVVLRKDGADQADVRRFEIRPGGDVSIEHVSALGTPGKAAGIESLVRLVAAVGTQGARGLDPARIAPTVVEGLVKREIEATLRPALLQWVNENAAVLPGIDLRSVLGLPSTLDLA